MQEEVNPTETIIKTATETLVKELYSDIKSWALSGIRPVEKIIKNIKKKKYSDINQLQLDISNNKIKNGELVEIECKFSSFGPFIKPNYIGPLSGLNTQNRLGPPLLHSNPLFGMVAQTTSNLLPVGIYPAVSEKVAQVRLYPSATEAFGFIGLFPDVNKIVPSFNALIKPEYLNIAHKSCKLSGRINCISQKDFVDAGYALEDFEIVRTINNIWFFDATGKDSDCKVMDSEVKELWGALYSAGHIEFDGDIQINKLINGYLEKLGPHVEDLQVAQNKVKNKEVNIYGKGFRMVQHVSFPIYALHYDIDIGTNYVNQRDSYEKILNAVLQNIDETCKQNSVKLFNPNELDFNYSNSSVSYKIMESLAANRIEDPLAIAIRQWYKNKN